MEQAVNSFLKGLLLDTYPALLGKESLSDALNATLVTLTGNELVLQNDMGNRRVDNAFLPSGYEPIGIKEHGGIIYVAAYNPITGRGLIGSFPSPLKKENISDDTAGIDFDDFIIEKENDWTVKRETLLIPLTGKNVLHAGDKFSIYYGGIVDLKSYLTNYDLNLNTPNRLFTLSVGILNSQNEFVDITKDLIRWNNQPGVENVPPTNGDSNTELPSETGDTSSTSGDSNSEPIPETGDVSPTNEEEGSNSESTANEEEGSNTETPSEVEDTPPTSGGESSNNKPEVIDTSSMSEEVKFNTGYFIATQNNVPENSENKDFIQFRLSLALNNYNYKLVSPLYLKAQINHILDYTYTVYGEKTEISETENGITEEFITLDIEFDFDVYYNCPIDGFEFDIFDPELISEKSISPSPMGFDSSIGLYHNKLIQKYKIERLPKSENENKIINYEIKTPLIHGYYHSDDNPETFKTIYVPSLTRTGTLNVSLFGSDTILFKGFRYYNDLENKNTIFKINIESYPKKETSLIGPFFDIYESTNSINYIQRREPEINSFLSGEITYKLEWNESINERQLYYIKFGYATNPIDIEEHYFDENFYKFLTTELFNGNFMQSNNSSNSTFDSSNPYNHDLHGYEYIPDFGKIEKVKVIPEVSWKYKLDSSNNNIITDNSISTSTPDLLNVSPYYKISHLSNNTIKLYNIISVKDSELYPSNVKFENLYIENYNLDSFTIGNTTYTNTGTVTINDNLYTTVGGVGLGNDDHIITVNCKIPTDVAESQEHNITDEENQNENPLTLTVDPVTITIDPNNHTSNDDDKVIIEKNPDGFIPEDIETGYIQSGNGKEIIFNYVVNNIIKSNFWTRNKVEFTINNVITSFYKFVKDNSLYNIQAPYFDLNFNHAALQWIIKSGNNPGDVANDDSEIGDYLTSEYNVSYMSVINNAGEAFNKSHENHIFIMDCDNADKIYKVNNSYNIYKDPNNPTTQGFIRIWIRYSENKFIPFLIYNGPNDPLNGPWIPSGISLLDTTNNENDILKQCKNMKQYYAFKSGSLSKELYTLPEDKYVKSKEFDFTSYITIEYSDNELSLNNASDFFIAGLINEEKYVIPHNFNIKSNDDFLEYVNDYIFNRNINCAIIDDDDKIYVGEGNLDPLYMYEKKSNTEFIKRQIPPTKISLGNNLYLPCLSLNNKTIDIGTLWDLRLQSHITIFSFNNIPLIFGNNF